MINREFLIGAKGLGSIVQGKNEHFFHSDSKGGTMTTGLQIFYGRSREHIPNGCQLPCVAGDRLSSESQPWGRG